MAAASLEDGLCYNSTAQGLDKSKKNHDMHQPRQSSLYMNYRGFFKKKSLNTRQLGQLKGLLTIFPSIHIEKFSVCHPAVVCRL